MPESLLACGRGRQPASGVGASWKLLSTLLLVVPQRNHPTSNLQVGMAPFLLLELGTIPAYGVAGWMDVWNGLDLLTYLLQVGGVAGM